MIIVQTCLGEEPRARPDAPSRALLPPRPGREPAAGRSRVRGRRGSGVGGAGARRLRCFAAARGVGAASAGGEAERRGCRRAARAPSPAVSASPPSPLHIFGAGRRRAPRPPAARLPARARSLGGTAPRRADGLPAAGALIPGPAPSVPARGGPGPALRAPAPPGRAAPRPGTAPRPWLSTRAPHARSAARSLGGPRSGVGCPASGPAPRYAGRRRIVSSEEAAEPLLGRPRSGRLASSARRRHLVAAARQRALPATVRGRGRGSLRHPPAVTVLSPAFESNPHASSPKGRGPL